MNAHDSVGQAGPGWQALRFGIAERCVHWGLGALAVMMTTSPRMLLRNGIVPQQQVLACLALFDLSDRVAGDDGSWPGP